MKCGIVTVYNSENCGSYLQAYALSQKITNLGHEAVLVQHNYSDHASSSLNLAKSIAKVLLKGNIFAMKLLINRKKAFKLAISRLNVEQANDSIGCYVLGSDTIWDVSRPYFNNHMKLFWGTEFVEKSKVVSYAASLGFASRNDVQKYDMIPNVLVNMSSISVREDIAKEILQPFIDKEIHVVCDPTLLLAKDDYDKLTPHTDYNKFIFVYNYGKMSQVYIKEITKIAKNENLKIITFGNLGSWCDISLAYDPFLFLAMLERSKYIITNTFHGTVFAHIFEKKFFVIDCEKTKVNDFLKKHHTYDKCSKEASEISQILNSNYNYEKINSIISKEREAGISFLRKAIED